MIITRSEIFTEYVDIFEVSRLAFGRENEARLVENIRHLPNFNSALSLVAIENDRLVGHILFSEIAIASPQGDIIPFCFKHATDSRRYQLKVKCHVWRC